MILPVIISGGSGERLWPVSRATFPKPFIIMPDGQSLLQKAFLRAASQESAGEILTVTGRDHYFKTRSEYQAVNIGKKTASFILEPAARNTAPAIAMAAHYASAKYGEDTILLALPADQLITDDIAFTEAVMEAENLARRNLLVTFGITPTRPETGYGYIECGEGSAVKCFVEKPDLDAAVNYIKSGKHLWNSGMFCFKAGIFLRELELHCPELATSITRAMPDCKHLAQNYIEPEEAVFAAIAEISIDYALMEKSQNRAVVACDIGWNDLGSWSAMGNMLAADASGNSLLGEVYTHETTGCFIQADGRVIAAVGARDLVIIDTPDALLVADRARAQHVKKIVAQLKECGHPASREHTTVYRSWGRYTVLQESAGFKIKRIEVLPHQKLSLQVHEHRSEHWVVVSGKARVQNGEEVFELLPSQSTNIPAGHKHRLQNAGGEMLVIVEVQCGLYLGEDDITRLEDSYELQIPAEVA
jgi:mannose-1-phosphate guanylyltransferase